VLATFVIGLREGLEAALIVGIIAAFLRANGRSLVPMWVGVVTGVVLSVGVGVTLSLVESSLDQRAQEGMESVIGAMAVVFVTGMILWMASHARGMKRQLESSARSALATGSSRALVAMAFLAVLKEGFETSVFLLATFSASANATLAATGAVLGVLGSAGIGYGLYSGGVRLDLARFFRATSVFLVLVAAGLVLSALRTAHEAGWLNAGQQRTVDLSWVAPTGSVRAAVVTGVLGIPADPRLVEVIGWVAYLVPMALLLFWPQGRRLTTAQGARLKAVLAIAFVAAAAVLALTVPAPTVADPGSAPLADDAGAQVGTAQLIPGGASMVVEVGGVVSTVSLSGALPGQHAGLTATHVTREIAADTTGLPTSVTLAQLVTLGGGRVPVGIDPRRHPGPYAATWTRTGPQTAWVAGGHLLDATQRDVVVLTLSGSGLPASRTLTLASGTPMPDGTTTSTWSVSPTYVDGVAASVAGLTAAQDDADLWRRVLPLALGTAALLLALGASRSLRRQRRSAPPVGATSDRQPVHLTTTPRSTADVRDPTRRPLAVASAAALGLLLTACGSGGDSTGAGASAAPAAGSAAVAPVSDGAARVAITATQRDGADTCELDHASAAAGPVTFTVSNADATSISEIELLTDSRILGEKENLAPGLAPVSFTVSLTGGTYQVYCPGAATETQPFTVTGRAAASPTGSTQTILADGVKGYAAYVSTTIADMQGTVAALRMAVDSGDVMAARKAYAAVRPYYEKVESDVEGFLEPGADPTANAGNLDYLVDVRSANLDPAVGWTGMHAIERDLWKTGAITTQTKTWAAHLQTDIAKLTAVAKALTYQPADLANGAAGLLEEVQSGKITGDELEFSHLDLLDFSANVEGAQQAFSFLEPGLEKIDPALTAQVRAQFTTVRDKLSTYRDTSAVGGFRPYAAALRASDAAGLSKAVQGLQDPLSRIAEKVATAQ